MNIVTEWRRKWWLNFAPYSFINLWRNQLMFASCTYFSPFKYRPNRMKYGKNMSTVWNTSCCILSWNTDVLSSEKSYTCYKCGDIRTVLCLQLFYILYSSIGENYGRVSYLYTLYRTTREHGSGLLAYISLLVYPIEYYKRTWRGNSDLFTLYSNTSRRCLFTL